MYHWEGLHDKVDCWWLFQFQAHKTHNSHTYWSTLSPNLVNTGCHTENTIRRSVRPAGGVPPDPQGKAERHSPNPWLLVHMNIFLKGQRVRTIDFPLCRSGILTLVYWLIPISLTPLNLMVYLRSYMHAKKGEWNFKILQIIIPRLLFPLLYLTWNCDVNREHFLDQFCFLPLFEGNLCFWLWIFCKILVQLLTAPGSVLLASVAVMFHSLSLYWLKNHIM